MAVQAVWSEPSQVSRAGGAVDTVITNALIVAHWGIVKADVGLRDGKIAGIGKPAIPTPSPASTPSPPRQGSDCQRG